MHALREDKNGRKELPNEICNLINKDGDLLLVATIASEIQEEMEDMGKDLKKRKD